MKLHYEDIDHSDDDREQFDADNALIGYTPDPNCPACHGDGYYWEDVIGDGGSRERIVCECVPAAETPEKED